MSSHLTKSLEQAKAEIETALKCSRLVDGNPADEVRRLLAEVYGALWREAYYDGLTVETMKFARPLADMMVRLNEIIGFRK